jgi:adenosylmethionine-8-amino-7-oxononanoate aminotransferase
LGKGITAGYLPMAATLARPKIYDAFLGETSASRQFFHGHTFAGNPLAAAAALTSLDLIAETDLIASVDRKADRLRSRIANLVGDHPNVGSIRGRGLMVGIELVKDRDSKMPFDAAEGVGRRACEASIDRGVWIRPLSDVIIVMPPLVASDKELDLLADVVGDSIISTCV